MTFENELFYKFGELMEKVNQIQKLVMDLHDGQIEIYHEVEKIQKMIDEFEDDGDDACDDGSEKIENEKNARSLSGKNNPIIEKNIEKTKCEISPEQIDDNDNENFTRFFQ